MSFYEVFCIAGTMVCCTYVICNKLNTFVTHEVCTRRRENCTCVEEIERIKRELKER
ncbi:hypothetical protein [Victivallis sp. Marseille-Q1083]|uniref:hypothetical protein n=1 Tax=Victivallis sp. Marseille-Q1083 TaxID=2717288 RepID=UPI00158EAFCB|nr:hypothetical protein [Victivallis sp. Marseille-Q1083]